MVSQAADNLRQGMEQIRSTVHQMKAQAPDMNRQEMDTIIERFRRDSGLTTHYQVARVQVYDVSCQFSYLTLVGTGQRPFLLFLGTREHSNGFVCSWEHIKALPPVC